MSTPARTRPIPPSEYPTGDGKPLAETPLHRDNPLGLIELLRRHFAGDPQVYISGNMFLYYEEGNKRRHVSPDVFVVRGIEGTNNRDAYFTWIEGKGPDVVVEFTSRSTRKEDLEKKFALYRDVLHVREYILFDPRSEYLKPPLQGYRLVEGRYEPIEPVGGRLPSEVLGLHFVAIDRVLRVHDPALGRLVPTSSEAEAGAVTLSLAAEIRAAAAVAERLQAERLAAEEAAERIRAERLAAEALAGRRRAEEEIERLRRELDALKRDAGPQGTG